MSHPENNGTVDGVEENQESYDSGFRLLYRALIDHPYLGFKKPFSRSEAFIWLLLNACGKKEGMTIKVKIKNVERECFVGYGQYVFSLRSLASKWGWGIQKVRTYLHKLQGDRTITTGVVVITQQITQQLTQLTICNFRHYQNRQHSKQHSKKHTKGTRSKGTVVYTSYNTDDPKKKPPIPENLNGKETVLWFCATYEYYFETPYLPNWKIDGAHMKRLVGTYGQELFGIIDHYLNTERNDRYFWTTVSRTPAKLSSFINDVIQHRKEFAL